VKTAREEGAAVALLDVADGIFRLAVIQVGDHDVCSLARIGKRDRTSNSASTAGHHRRFACQHV
jgi:hypothetical protein